MQAQKRAKTSGRCEMCLRRQDRRSSGGRHRSVDRMTGRADKVVMLTDKTACVITKLGRRLRQLGHVLELTVADSARPRSTHY